MVGTVFPSMKVDERPGAAVADLVAQPTRHRSRRRSLLPMLGPALIASIAYMDPGNFVTNIAAGARYKYDLLWVVVLANLIAMLIQAMAAKLGIVTRQNLAELVRAHSSPPMVWALWGISEIGAMATDLAELVGGAIGFSLLFNVPLLAGMVVTGVLTYAILILDRSGYRRIEQVIGGLIFIIAVCYIIELFVAPPNWGMAAWHSIVPRLPDNGALALTVAIVGATVMPHAIYLHSSLTQSRVHSGSDEERRQLLRFSNRETVITLTLAGLVNLAMVLMAADNFNVGHADITEIGAAYHTLVPLLGAGAATIFLVSLLASGVSSSVVGTMAGQVIMQGFLRRQIPVWLRRLLTMLPAFLIVAAGVNVTTALIYSQIALSLVLPAPMIALLYFSRRKDIMGNYVSSRGLHSVALAATLLVLGLNVILLLLSTGMTLPFLPR